MTAASGSALRSTACSLTLSCTLLLTALTARAAPSELSHWLALSLAPELIELLADHPRYRERPVSVVNRGADALGDDVVRVLRSRLAREPDVVLGSTGVNETPALSHAIDELACTRSTSDQLQLQVRLGEAQHERSRISFELVESDAHGARTERLWHFPGTLTRAERARARQAAEQPAADGSLDMPWTYAQVEPASRALSRELACRLRPQIRTRLRLRWVDQQSLPALFRDTLNSSRHQLSIYRELVLAEDPADYVIEAELRPFRADTVQLWLHARPTTALLEPVQAVAYFSAPGLQLAAPAAEPAAVHDARRAADYLHVELLHARQRGRGLSGADLSLTLRLTNRADRPLAFALRLSGGHFLQCLPDPQFYRHDRYGTLRGTLAPGASETRRLVVEKLQHAPLPWFGTPRCAGSLDLDALENFATEGARITDYVRWDL